MKRVLFHSPSCRNLFGDVVFATDFSEYSFKALPLILKVPDDVIKLFTILHVIDKKNVEIEDYEKSLAEKLESVMSGLNYRFAKEKSNLEIAVRKGVPFKEIIDFIEETGKKLLVLGFKGKDREDLKEIIFGGTVERIISALPCSILIAK